MKINFGDPPNANNVQDVLTYVKKMQETLEFWATRIGQDNINFGDMMNENGIHPKYIDPFRNFFQNSQFEVRTGNSPTWWKTTGSTSTDAAFSGTVSLKITNGQYIENDTMLYSINSSWWQAQPARISFMKKGGKVKVEVVDANNNNASIFIYNEKGVRGTYHIYDYNSNWNTYKDGTWNYGLCSVTFDCLPNQSIKVRVTNIDDKNAAYIDTMMLSPDITKHPVLYKDGARSTAGVNGREVKDVYVGTTSEINAITSWEDKDLAVFTDDYTEYRTEYVAVSKTLTTSQSGVLFCNNTITVTLPALTPSLNGLTYTFKNIGLGVITINGNGFTIDGDGVYTRQLPSQWDKMKIVTNGYVWYII